MKPQIFIQFKQGVQQVHKETEEVSLSIPHPDGSHQKEILEFRFTDGERWNGSFTDLQNALKVAKGMKDFEESCPIKQPTETNPTLRGTNDTVTLTSERRQDMLCGALEGGSNYWYLIRSKADSLIRKADPSENKPFVDRLWTALEAGLSIEVHDYEDPQELLGSISLQAMDEGEKLMQEKQPEHFADILSENDDATTADVWFQYVVLKELVYG